MDKYFFYDPTNGFETFETLAAQETAVKEAIAAYFEDGYGWEEDVAYIVSGVITHQATRCDVKNKPPELDEEGYDKDGQDWTGDNDYICNYEMKEIDAKDNIMRKV